MSYTNTSSSQSNKPEYTIIYTKDEEWNYGRCIKVYDTISEGKTLEELKKM